MRTLAVLLLVSVHTFAAMPPRPPKDRELPYYTDDFRVPCKFCCNHPWHPKCISGDFPPCCIPISDYSVVLLLAGAWLAWRKLRQSC